MAETRTINLEIQDNVKSLKTQYKEAVQEVQRLAQAYGETSQEAAEAAKRAAQLKDQIEDTNDAIASFKGEGIFTATGKALGAVASGFSAVEGAVALTGVESKKLQETMVRLQAAMALAQGLEGLEDAGRAFKTLSTRVLDFGKTALTAFQGMTTAGKAFAVTGVGLIITAVGFLLSNMAKLKQTFFGVTEVQQAQKEATIAGAKAMSEATMTVNEVAFAFEQAKKGIISKEKALKTYNEKLGNTIGTTNDLNEAERIFRENSGKYIKAVQARAIAQALAQKAAEKLAEAETAAMESQLTTADYAEIGLKGFLSTTALGSLFVGSFEEQAEDADERNKQRTKETQERAKEAFATLNKLSETYLKDAMSIESELDKGKKKIERQSGKESVNYTKQVQKENIDAMEDGMDKRIKLLEFERDNELSEIDKKGKKAGELKKAIETRYEKEIEDVKKEFRDRSDRDDQIHLEKLPIKRLEIGKQEIDAEKYVQGELARLRQEQKQRDLEDLKDKTDIILKYAKTFTDVYSSLNGLLNASDNERLKKVEKGSAEEKKIRKRMFQRDKALRISQTVVDTASNIVTSVRNGGGVPFGLPFGFAAGTMGALQIAAIAKTKFDGGEQSTNQNSPDATAGTNASAPQFNTIGSSGVNQLAQLQNVPVQAYVVSGEVTSAQALDRNRVQNATL